jgi:hypothetical protein
MFYIYIGINFFEAVTLKKPVSKRESQSQFLLACLKKTQRNQMLPQRRKTLATQ